MHETMPRRGLMRRGAIWIVVGAVLASNIVAVAQIAMQRAADPSQRQVVLVRQDASDCSGSDVPNVDSPAVSGTIWATRLFDGNTSVKVAVTIRPNTAYRLAIKCVRPIGDVKTDDEGVANISFAFPTNLVGPVYSFELAADAPPGNKYQSAQVSFR